MTIDIGVTMGIKFREPSSYNLKKFVKMEKVDIAERISAFDDSEEDVRGVGE